MYNESIHLYKNLFQNIFYIIFQYFIFHTFKNTFNIFRVCCNCKVNVNCPGWHNFFYINSWYKSNTFKGQGLAGNFLHKNYDLFIVCTMIVQHYHYFVLHEMLSSFVFVIWISIFLTHFVVAKLWKIFSNTFTLFYFSL